MTVEQLHDSMKWEHFVESSPEGWLFHSWKFLKITEKYSGFTFLPFAFKRGSEVLALFPLFYCRKWGVKCLFSPPPVTGIPYLGPVWGPEYYSLSQSQRENRQQQFMSAIGERIAQLNPHYLSISLSPGCHDVRPYVWQGFSVRPAFYYSRILTEELDQIWSDCQANLRRYVRKAEQEGLQMVEMKEAEQLFDRLSARYAEQGLRVPILSGEYLSELLRSFPGRLRLYGVRNEQGQTLAMILLHGYKRAILWQGGIKSPGRSGANEYLIWQLIRLAKEEGFERLELAGASRPNLNAFNVKFNPELEIGFVLTRQNWWGRLAACGYHCLKQKNRIAANTIITMISGMSIAKPKLAAGFQYGLQLLELVAA